MNLADLQICTCVTTKAKAYLERPLISVCAHVHGKGGGIGELFGAKLAGEPAWGVPLGQRSAAVHHHVLRQGRTGGEAFPARREGAAQRRLARMREPVQVQPVLRHAAVAAHVALELTADPAASVTFKSVSLRRFACAALRVHIQHTLVQELRTTMLTCYWFFIYRTRKRTKPGVTETSHFVKEEKVFTNKVLKMYLNHNKVLIMAT